MNPVDIVAHPDRVAAEMLVRIAEALERIADALENPRERV